LRLLPRRGGAGLRREPLALHLDLNLGVGLQVAVPRRRLVGAALGRHHQVVLAVPAEDQRVAALLPRAPARGREDEEGGALASDVALLAVGGEVPIDMLLALQHRLYLLKRLDLRLGAPPRRCTELRCASSPWLDQRLGALQ